MVRRMSLLADGIVPARIKSVAAGAMPVSGVIGRRVEITMDGAAR